MLSLFKRQIDTFMDIKESKGYGENVRKMTLRPIILLADDSLCLIYLSINDPTTYVECLSDLVLILSHISETNWWFLMNGGEDSKGQMPFSCYFC